MSLCDRAIIMNRREKQKQKPEKLEIKYIWYTLIFTSDQVYLYIFWNNGGGGKRGLRNTLCLTLS